MKGSSFTENKTQSRAADVERENFRHQEHQAFVDNSMNMYSSLELEE